MEELGKQEKKEADESNDGAQLANTQRPLTGHDSSSRLPASIDEELDEAGNRRTLDLQSAPDESDDEEYATASGSENSSDSDPYYTADEPENDDQLNSTDQLANHSPAENITPSSNIEFIHATANGEEIIAEMPVLADTTRQQHTSAGSPSPIRQETGGAYCARLGRPPETAVELHRYLMYVLLILTICKLLASGDDEIRFNEWAAQFQVNTGQSIYVTFLELDELGMITGTNLERLVGFLQRILRFDVIVLIGQFLMGDYTLLHEISFNEDTRNQYFPPSELCLDLPETPTL